MANQRHPVVEFEDFTTRALADACAKARRKSGFTVCVSPTPAPRVLKPARQTEKFNAQWRMAP
jgi:hypothetical protein